MQTHNPCRRSRRVEFAWPRNECTARSPREHSQSHLHAHAHAHAHGYSPSYNTTGIYKPSLGCSGHNDEHNHDRHILFKAPTPNFDSCSYGPSHDHGYGYEDSCPRKLQFGSCSRSRCCGSCGYHNRRNCYQAPCQCQDVGGHCTNPASALRSGGHVVTASATADAQNMSVRATAQANRGHDHGRNQYLDRYADPCGNGYAGYPPSDRCGGGCQGQCRENGQEVLCCVPVEREPGCRGQCHERDRARYAYGPPLPIVVDVAIDR
ncbi:hypothetical protein BJX63DRAFT_317812 [Aspergillus granulosus]|uniref:Uncharacterized protein n=1 Tax=Aspergillus granulosus TaxID=176169 RepID=A0ABR4H4I9_9EURO